MTVSTAIFVLAFVAGGMFLIYSTIHRKGLVDSFKDGYIEGRMNALLREGLEPQQARVVLEREKLARTKKRIEVTGPLTIVALVIVLLVSVFTIPISIPIWLFLCWRAYRQMKLYYEKELPDARARIRAEEAKLNTGAR